MDGHLNRVIAMFRLVCALPTPPQETICVPPNGNMCQEYTILQRNLCASDDERFPVDFFPNPRSC